jgi:hypothetical protein
MTGQSCQASYSIRFLERRKKELGRKQVTDTHNAKILRLQDKWIETCSIAYLGEMLLVMEEQATNFIKKEISKKGFFLSDDEIAHKAHVAADYVIQQFIKRPTFRLSVPGGYVYKRVQQSLYEKVDCLDNAGELFDESVDCEGYFYIDYNGMTKIQFYKNVLLLLKDIEIDELSSVSEVEAVLLQVRYKTPLGFDDRLTLCSHT